MPDMRQILQMAKADAPPGRHSVDDIVAAGKRRVFRRRVGGMGAVAAAFATAAVLVAVNLAVPGGHSVNMPVVPAANPPAPKAEPWPAFTFMFNGFQVDDLHVMPPDEIDLVSQNAVVVRGDKPDSPVVGILTLYQPGRFSPDVYRSGTKVTVQGRDAYELEVTSNRPVASDPNGENPTFETKPFIHTELAWQWAPDAWATLISEETRYQTAGALPFADELKVAERFTISPGAVAKVPFRIGYLPAGFVLTSVSGQSMTASNRGMVTLTYAKPDASTGPVNVRRDPTTTRAKTTSVVIGILEKDAPPPDAVKRTSRCNAGDHFCVTDLPDRRYWFSTEDPSKSLPDSELLKVADSIAWAKITDATTWYDAA